jgi:deoxycytidylate deaminase
MAAKANTRAAKDEPAGDSTELARQALDSLVRSEPERHPLVLGLVSPLGTPLDSLVRTLEGSFARFDYAVTEIHVSQLLDDLPFRPWGDLPKRGEHDYYELRMNAGDILRSAVGSGAALAALAIAKISRFRHETARNVAFVVRSLKHPDEEALLRHVYGDAFSLIGVSSSADERREALTETLAPFEDARAEAERLIARDDRDLEHKSFGQNVRGVYSEADVYFPIVRGLDLVPEVNRFVDSLFGHPFLTPRFHEEAMRLAADASLRSAAIGRQVGAALIPTIGTPIVVGTNEVPKPGGGQYWADDRPDHRDFQTGEDPNPLYTRRVVQELLESLAERRWFTTDLRSLSGQELLERAQRDGVLDGVRAASLIEFTRCLHAEQAAIVNAARAGISTLDAILFTTTFPCHECAKMIIGAGIVEVFYIEPYPKSMVSRLYRDLVDTAPPLVGQGGLVGGRVPFRAFQGIAPRRYDQAFVAGERSVSAGTVAFDPLSACPRTGGWSESAVGHRETVAIGAIQHVLNTLSREGLPAATANREIVPEPQVEQAVLGEAVAARPPKDAGASA